MPARSTHFLALVSALAVAGCGGGGGGGGSPTAPPPPGGAQVATVEIHDDEFQPRSITVAPGTTVRWVLRGQSTDHTTTARDGTWNSGFAFRQQGATFERTFGAAEQGRTFEYSCVTHQACCQMQGSVRVGENAPPPSPGY